MSSKLKLLLAVLLLGACSRETPQTGSAPDSAATAQPAPAMSTTDSIVGRWRARMPDSLLLRRGACPFECCMYSEWALGDSAVVRSSPQRSAAPAFVVQDSTRFQADSGFVRVTQLQLVVVSDTVDQRPYAPLFLPGDTLIVLDHTGEGHFNVWSSGKVVNVEGFWGAERPEPVAEMIGSYAREWWAHITMKDGKNGWLLIEPQMKLIGADKCGGPPYWQRQ